MTSNLSAFAFIPERAPAVPALWNDIFSILSSNIAAVDSNASFSSPSSNTISISTNLEVVGGGHFQFLSVGSTPPSYLTTAAVTIEVNSAFSDYLYLVDSSAQKSSYIIGSRAGNLADGLNIWDASAGTMIASFSKQSIRFFQQVVGPVFDVGGALASTYNAATFGSATDSTESRIQAAINQASIDNFARVYLPASMQSFSASSISFVYTIQMVGEGTDWTVWDTRVYGVKGNGTKDDRAALQECENSRPAYGTMRFASGKTYLINASYDGSLSEASKLLKVRTPGVWDLNGAQLRWGSSSNLIVGTDGAGLGMVNILAAPWTLNGFGVLDGQSKVRSPLCFKDDQSGFILFTEIKNLRETAGLWDGTMCTVSVDVTGTSATTRAKNISGIIRRPSCPMGPNDGTIATHVDVTAFLWGGAATHQGNHTSHVLVLSDALEPLVNTFPGLIAVPQYVSNNTANFWHADFSACDINNNVLETQGYLLAGYWSSVTTLGHAIKNGAVSGWFDYNVISSDTRPPNVAIQGGSAQSKGLIEIRGPIRASDDLFPYSKPSYAFLSEASLGWLRSGASSVALSYGTLYLPSGISTGGIVSAGSDVVSSFGQLRGSRVSTDLGVGDRLFTNANYMRAQPSTLTTENVTLTLEAFATASAVTWNLSFAALNGSSAAAEYGRLGASIVANTAGAHTGAMTISAARAGLVVPVIDFTQLGQISSVTSGMAIAPAYTFQSEKSTGLYWSGIQTIAQSQGTLNLATNAVRLSMRTLAASSVTASAVNTNVARNEVVFTVGGASGASLCISSGGTLYIFNSATSAILA